MSCDLSVQWGETRNNQTHITQSLSLFLAQINLPTTHFTNICSGSKGHVEILKILMEKLDSKDLSRLILEENGKQDNLLSVVVAKEHVTFLKSLMECDGVDRLLELRNKSGLCPIHIAAERGNADVMDLILRNCSFANLEMRGEIYQ